MLGRPDIFMIHTDAGETAPVCLFVLQIISARAVHLPFHLTVGKEGKLWNLLIRINRIKKAQNALY